MKKTAATNYAFAISSLQLGGNGMPLPQSQWPTVLRRDEMLEDNCLG